MNKPNLSRNYITLQNPYNKQVFIEQICIFRQWSIYSEIVTIPPIWSTTIDLYQNQSDMLTARKSWIIDGFVVNKL